MKKIKLLLIITSSLLVLTGCMKPEEKVQNSINYLEDKTYYKIHTDFMQNESTYSISYTFDEKSGITEKDIHIDSIPKSSQYSKIDENNIIKYYGEYVINPDLEDTYYLKNWNKEILEKTEENISEYKFLDKNFYIEMIKNALEYKKTDNGYEVLVSKKYIQDIVNQLQDKQYIVEDDMYVKVTLDGKNLDILQFSDYSNNLNNVIVMFQTKIDKSEEQQLEFPEVE